MPSIVLSPLEHHIRRKLMKRRSLFGYTQKQLAGLVGTKYQQVYKYEAGVNRISVDLLYKLSLALAVPISYWFEGYSPSLAQSREARPDVR